MKYNDFWEANGEASRTHRYLLYSKEGPEILEWTENLEPLVKIGKKMRNNMKKVHERKYGTLEEKRKERAEYQHYLDAAFERFPNESFSEHVKCAADHFDKSAKTIMRYTTNPRSSKKS